MRQRTHGHGNVTTGREEEKYMQEYRSTAPVASNTELLPVGAGDDYSRSSAPFEDDTDEIAHGFFCEAHLYLPS